MVSWQPSVLESISCPNNLDTATAASLLALRTLLQSQQLGSTIIEVVQTLARRVEEIKHPDARACVVWLVGQYASDSSSALTRNPYAIEGIAEWAPDVLRIMAKRFTTEVSVDSDRVYMREGNVILDLARCVEVGNHYTGS